jgi:hypothetical protein
MAAPLSDEEVSVYLRELEESLLQPDVRKSNRPLELLAENFLEFASSGRIYRRADLLTTLQAESPVVQTTSDFKVAILTPDVALLTYRIHRHSDPPVHTLRSSVWQQKEGRWRMVFHQATVTSPRPQPVTQSGAHP